MVLLTYKKSLKQNKKRSVDNHARKHRGFMQISINSSVECTFFSHIHRNKSKRGRHVGTSWQGEASSKMMQARQEFKQDKKAGKTRQRSLLSDTNVPYWRACVHNCVSQILKTVTDGKLLVIPVSSCAMSKLFSRIPVHSKQQQQQGILVNKERANNLEPLALLIERGHAHGHRVQPKRSLCEESKIYEQLSRILVHVIG